MDMDRIVDMAQLMAHTITMTKYIKLIKIMNNMVSMIIIMNMVLMEAVTIMNSQVQLA